MEKGCTPGKYKRKSLEEINFDVNLEYAEENNVNDFGKALTNNIWTFCNFTNF